VEQRVGARAVEAAPDQALGITADFAERLDLHGRRGSVRADPIVAPGPVPQQLALGFARLVLGEILPVDARGSSMIRVPATKLVPGGRAPRFTRSAPPGCDGR